MAKETELAEITADALLQIAKQLQNLGWGDNKFKGSIGQHGDQIEEGAKAIASSLDGIADAIENLAQAIGVLATNK